MHPRLVSLVERGVIWRTGRRYDRYLSRFAELERGPRELVDRLRAERLQAVVRHAVQTVPYWKDLFASLHARPEDIRRPQDLTLLPTLDKTIINAEKDRMLSTQAPAGRTTVKSTGGSTGHNVWLVIDIDTHDRRRAAGRLTESWDAAEPGVRQAVLWGSRLETKMSRKARLLDKLSNRIFLSVYGVGDVELAAHLRQLERFRPEVISSYPSILLHIARRLGRAACRRIGARVVYSSAEMLTPPAREELEDCFGAPVRDRYAAREFGMIASDCSEGEGLHLMDMRLIVESVPSAVAGMAPELVITDLDNLTMPLIRYRIEDLGQVDDRRCSCGRSWRRLRQLDGRVFDVIVAPDGRAFGGSFFPILLRPMNRTISRFQVVQDRLDHLRIKLVPGEGWDDSCRGRLRRLVREKLGPAMAFDLDEVDEIAPLPSGKHRFVVSLLDEATRQAAAGD